MESNKRFDKILSYHPKSLLKLQTSLSTLQQHIQFSVLDKICDALNCEVSDILGHEKSDT